MGKFFIDTDNIVKAMAISLSNIENCKKPILQSLIDECGDKAIQHLGSVLKSLSNKLSKNIPEDPSEWGIKDKEMIVLQQHILQFSSTVTIKVDGIKIYYHTSDPLTLKKLSLGTRVLPKISPWEILSYYLIKAGNARYIPITKSNFILI
jgi:hypothetical protein